MFRILVESNTKHFLVKIEINAFPVRGYIYGPLKKVIKKIIKFDEMAKKNQLRRCRNHCFEIWTFEVIKYISIANAKLKY